MAPARVSRARCVTAKAAAEGKMGKVKKVVLAYSGGLDTSIILKWLQDEYGCEVVTFTADLGQVSGARMQEKAKSRCACSVAHQHTKSHDVLDLKAVGPLITAMA